MPADLVIVVATGAAARIADSGVADATLSNAASLSAPLALCGIASLTFVETGVADVTVVSVAIGDPTSPADIAIGAVYAPPAPRLANPQFSYADGRLARIDYDGPHAKIFAYQNGRLATLDYSDGFRTLRKSFVYDASGALASIVEGYV
jgi:hypothetical protein